VVLTATISALIAVPTAVWASHSFNDVPSSNTFHADIAWLSDANVTRGCNPPTNTEFCPDDPVTREQMAAFMRRLAQYLGAEDGTPSQADNANTFDGMTLGEVIAAARPVAGRIGSDVTVPDPQEVSSPTSFSTTISAPLLIHAQGGLGLACSSSGTRWVWMEVDGEPVESSLAQVGAETTIWEALTLSGVTADDVPAGDHTLSFAQACSSGNASASSSTPPRGVFVYMSDASNLAAAGGQIAEDELTCEGGVVTEGGCVSGEETP
jgi:hypothetical protein